jgi:hypothetical protein
MRDYDSESQSDNTAKANLQKLTLTVERFILYICNLFALVCFRTMSYSEVAGYNYSYSGEFYIIQYVNTMRSFKICVNSRRIYHYKLRPMRFELVTETAYPQLHNSLGCMCHATLGSGR